MGLNLPNSDADILMWSGVASIIVAILIFFGYLLYYLKFRPIPELLKLNPTAASKDVKIYYATMIPAFILGFIGLTIAGISTQRSPIMGPAYTISGNDVTVSDPSVEPFGQEQQVTYRNIGYGPLVSRNKVNNWLNGKVFGSSEPGTSPWLDGNGSPIELPTPAFKSIYGFIPPSFEYFPAGQDTNLYNPENYEVGREKCMQACTLTNCEAVQTEVAQNCYHQTIQFAEATGEGNTPTPGEYDNACLGRSSHACTLFYKNLEDADDAYWKINEFLGDGLTGGCIGTDEQGESLIGCLGKKYYEDTDPALPGISPVQLPDGSYPKPSQSTVKWCDVNVASSNPNSMYAGSGCTCTTEEDCNDPACCRWRDLITTESLNASKPYYNLPLAVEASDKDEITGVTWSKLAKAVNVDSNGKRHCCGLCPTDGYLNQFTANSSAWIYAQNTNNVDDSQKVLKSCFKDKCSSPSDRNCWIIDKFAPEEHCSYDTAEDKQKYCTNTLNGRYCDGDPLDPNSDDAANALTAFKGFFNPDENNFNPLMQSCFYRNQAAIPAVQQYNCSSNTVERGCFGSPPVISTSSLEGPAGACSNDSIIPQSARCTLPKGEDGRPINTGPCDGFPYACGTQYGSNRLWVPVTNVITESPSSAEVP